MLDIAKSDSAMELLMPTPNSRLSLSLKCSFVCGSSDRPLFCKKLNRVSVDACIANSFTVPNFLSTSISALDLTPSINSTLN